LNEAVFFGLFADYAPDLKNERKRLKLAYSEGMIEKLYRCFEENKDAGELIKDCAKELSDTYGILIDEALLLIKSVWMALDNNSQLKSIIDGVDITQDMVALCVKASEDNYDALEVFRSRRDYFDMEAYEKSYFDICNLCLEGNTYAEVIMADYYYDGIVVDKNVKLAMLWAKKSAEAGNPAGMVFLNYCLLEVRGVTKDPQKAREYLDRAYSMDYPGAIYNMAYEYINDKKYEEGFREYNRIFDEFKSPYTRAEAAYRLAYNYITVKNNITESKYWIAKAIELYEFCNKNLLVPFLARHRELGYEVDYILNMYEEIGDKHSDIAARLVDIYSGGSGTIKRLTGIGPEDVQVNREKAEYWYNHYIELADRIAVSSTLDKYLSLLSNENYYSEIDKLEKTGKVDAVVLAQLIVAREKTEENKKKQFEYLLKGVEEKSAKACSELIKIYRDGELIDKNIAAVTFYYEKMREFGSKGLLFWTDTEYELSKIYKKGEGEVTADSDLYNYWYDKSKNINSVPTKHEKIVDLFNKKDFVELKSFLEKDLGTMTVSFSPYYANYCMLGNDYLGYIWAYGKANNSVDHVKAAEYFKKSNSTFAKNMLAAFYKKGFSDFPQNLEEYEKYKKNAGSEYKELTV